MIRHYFIRWQLIIWVAILFSGCRPTKEVLDSLDSRQSIEAMVVLSNFGIAVEREKTGSGTKDAFRLSVPTNEYLRALQIINEYGFPRREDQDFESCTNRQGFAPQSPEMASLRLDFALGLRIERLVRELPGVVEAKALVRSSFRSFVTRRGDVTEAESPAVVVTVRHVNSGSEGLMVLDEVRDIALKAVPGLKPEGIQVKPIRVDIAGDEPKIGAALGTNGSKSKGVQPLVLLNPLLPFYVVQSEQATLLALITVYLVLFCLSGGLIGFLVKIAGTRHYLNIRSKKREEPGVRLRSIDLSSAEVSPRATGRFAVEREAVAENGEEGPEKDV